MAVVEEGATVGTGFSILARLTGNLATGANVSTFGFAISGALGVPLTIKAVRMLTPTRVRIDFSRPVNNDPGLADITNYSIQNVNGSVAMKILSVDVPNESPAHFVTLNVTPATTGTNNYILTLNASTLVLGPELMIDGNMEASGTAAWTPVNATLTKQAGDPGGVGGAQILQVADLSSGLGDANQTHDLTVGAYRVSGQVRSADGLAAPFLDFLPAVGAGTTIFSGTTSTAWTSFQVDVSLTLDGMEEIRLGVTEVTGHPIAQFDNISVRKWISSRAGFTLITAFDDGTPVSSTAFFFDGFGFVPQLIAAIATSETTGKLLFSEPMLETADILKTSTYSINDGLTFVSTDGLDGAQLNFITGVQEEGQLYELTVNGVILDNYLNPLSVPVTTPFLGFISKLPTAKKLNLLMYNFLIRSLRDEDAKNGILFLQRFVQGPQTIWDSTVDTIYDIPSLWSAIDAPDNTLQFLKRIVGWTRQYDDITNLLSTPILRRLIASSVAFWKERGPESSIEDILTLLTGARCYVQNWFELRAIEDETEIGEDQDGIDFHLLGNAEDGSIDPYTYDVRIVDDENSLNRTLVKKLVQLTRPVGERVNIYYLAFLDQFDSDGDDTQWDIGVGNVADGVYRLVPGDGLTHTPALNALDWDNYVVSWKIRGQGKFRLFFYDVGVGDYYCVEIYTTTGSTPNTVKIFKAIAGTETNIGSVGVYTTFKTQIYDNTFYTFRIEVSNGGGDVNSICIYLDAERILSIKDSDQAQGSIGFQSLVGFAELSQVELFLLPMQTDFIDINS